MTYVSLSDPHIIYTSNHQREVWNVIRSFTSEHFVNQFGNDRISRSLSASSLSQLVTAKQSYNSKLPNSKDHVEILQPLEAIDMPHVTAEVANNAIQAIDFYNASKELPLFSRPILLHYAFEKLMNVLILLTYKIPTSTTGYSHGLTYYPNGSIEVKRKGIFQRFHDCYSIDPEIYLGKHAFTLDSILNAGQLYDENLQHLIQEEKHNDLMVQDANTKSRIPLFELDREFLLLFAISTLARYRVNEWSEIVAGKKSSDILRIERYLESIEMVFPNLIINQLYGKHFIFLHLH